MSDIAQTLSGVTSLLCAALIGLVVLSHRVREGPVIKLGLILMVMGLLASGVIALKGFDTAHGMLNAGLLMRCGLLVALLGYSWRVDFQQREKL